MRLITTSSTFTSVALKVSKPVLPEQSIISSSLLELPDSASSLELDNSLELLDSASSLELDTSLELLDSVLSLEFAVSLELLDSVLELEISMELLDSFFSSVVKDSLEMLFSSLLELDDAVSFGSVEDESPQAHIPTTTATVDNRPMRLFCFIAFL